MSDTCKRCGGTGEEPVSKAQPSIEPPFKHYDSLAELRAALLAPKDPVRLVCVRCDYERDMIISFGEPPPDPTVDAVTLLATIDSGSHIVVQLACGVCGPYPLTSSVDLRPIFDLHNLWGAEAIPEVLMRFVSEIRANAVAAKGAA